MAVQQATIFVRYIDDPYWGSVQLLLHGDGVDGQSLLTDSSDFGRSQSGGNILTKTDAGAFGGSAIQNPLTSDQVVFSYNFANANEDFTLEYWQTVLSSNCINDGYAASRGCFLWLGNAVPSGGTSGEMLHSANGPISGPSTTLHWCTPFAARCDAPGYGITNYQTRCHVLYVRDGATQSSQLYINGYMRETGNAIYAANNLIIGAANSNSGRYNAANVEEVRITRGVKRIWTSPYTVGVKYFDPPTGPYPS